MLAASVDLRVGALGIGQIVLAAVLLLAATGKLLNPAEFTAALRLSRLPAVLAHRVTAPIVVVEVALALLLLQARGIVLTLALALTSAVIAVFTGWMLWMLNRGLAVPCGCFGDQGTTVGPRSIMRNLSLLSLAVMTMEFSRGVSHTWVPTPLTPTSVTAAVLATSSSLVYVLAIAFWRARPALVLLKSQLLQPSKS